MIITNDIIKRALHESINEMIANKELLQEVNWGDTFKGAWNNIKNAAAMYMDWRTNGQWNNKYGMYANSSGKTTEMYYLNKWFNYHIQQIQLVARNMQNPASAQEVIDWKEDEHGNKVGTQTINRYNNIEEYAKKNINSFSFNTWIQNYIQNRLALKCIDEYIDNVCVNNIKDVKTALYYLNVGNFISNDYGQKYLESTEQDRNKYKDEREQAAQQATQQKADQEKKQKDKEKETIENLIQTYSDYLRKTEPHYSYYVISNSTYLPENFRKWLLEIITQYATYGSDEIANNVTIQNFMKKYGSYYN